MTPGKLVSISALPKRAKRGKSRSRRMTTLTIVKASHS
jgi:hypothetical protein